MIISPEKPSFALPVASTPINTINSFNVSHSTPSGDVHPPAAFNPPTNCRLGPGNEIPDLMKNVRMSPSTSTVTSPATPKEGAPVISSESCPDLNHAGESLGRIGGKAM